MAERKNRVLLLLLLLATPCTAAIYGRPHIILILADDLGWNDVSFHGSDQIPTPNIDALAYNGVILNSHYVQPTCTPTRAAFMTGRYPVHLGMQGNSLVAAESRGLPPGKILPQYLKDLGYTTRAVGKWHLGFYKPEVTPTYRGFDSHLGYWNDYVSYYDYILQERYSDGEYNGFDLRRNLSAAWELAGRYATDVFTDEAVRIIQGHDASPLGPPLFLYLAHLAVHAGNRGKLLEAPQQEIDKFRHIRDPNRRTYAAMVSKLDESVGRVVQALQRRHMLESSVILFLSDNGAPSKGRQPNWGSNWPLKGVKETLWEGGVRGVGLIWSPLLQQTPRVSSQLMHVTDWLPTLYTAAGGHVASLRHDLDGVDQWESLVYNLASPRREILHNIDERGRTAAVRFHNWKLIIGTVRSSALNGYFGHGELDASYPAYNETSVVNSMAGRAIIAASSSVYINPTRAHQISLLRSSAQITCPSNNSLGIPPCSGKELCLYDIESDPCESSNLAETHRSVALRLRALLSAHRNALVKQSNLQPDVRGANPKRWNGTWSPWLLDGCGSRASEDAYFNVCDRTEPL
ncbi:Arylsulfatase B [Cryptotermes secundus]|uniref:Arylsulfatase B n=1 Tax=Cryptotermes secundus TaxID=105785 RepID=A0A2J7RFV4_9NEOP|nr:arylsulfatase B [Cryptotermes secundus]PNF39716.1 Arylsulfatase B [Cryptotermes secundus]